MDCWRKLKPWPDVWMVWMSGFGHVPVGSGSWRQFYRDNRASPKTTVSRTMAFKISGDRPPKFNVFFFFQNMNHFYIQSLQYYIYAGSFVVLNVSNDATDETFLDLDASFVTVKSKLQL